MDIILKIKKYIRQKHLFQYGDRIIVGVSAGPDSVALAHILKAIQSEFGFDLLIAHYNHRLRKGSSRDQRFVKSLAQRLNLPFYTQSAKNLRAHKGSIEEIAREHRFSFFIQLAQLKKANHIALAHTQDDLAETILLRIIRGTGIQGLRGIIPQKKIEGMSFIRPLLTTTKREIYTFLKQNKISFRIDPTNRQSNFFRNKIRLKLLPLLEKEYNPNIRGILVNFSYNAVIDFDYLMQQTAAIFTKSARVSKKHIQFEIKKFKRHHPALQRMLIRMAIAYLKGNTNQITIAHYEEIDDLIHNRPVKSLVHLPKKIHVKKDIRQLTLCRGNI